MLTKTDLSQIKGIVKSETKKIVRQEIEAEGKNIRDDSRSELRSARMRIQEDVRELSGRIKNLEIRVNSMGREMKKEFKKVREEIKNSVNFLDKDYVRLKSKVERIKTHLKLESISP